jgi:hypothetical protein
VPRWNEDPTPILNILRTYLTHGPEEDPARHFCQGAELADESAAKLTEWRSGRRARRMGTTESKILLDLLLPVGLMPS